MKKPLGDFSGEEISFNPDTEQGLELMKNLVALPEENADVLLRILQYVAMDTSFVGFNFGEMEYLQTLDLIKFPFDYETFEAPYNTYYYNPDNSGRDDAFIKLLSGCALLGVLKKYDEEYGDGENSVAVGDMYHPPEWGDHATHGSGYCIDIRPVRYDGEQGRVTINDGDVGYSRSRSMNLVKLLAEAGASPLYFNDEEILNEVPEASRMAKHDNHIHACFESSAAVKKACFQGL